MIEVKIGDVVHVVRTRDEWYAVERKALAVIVDAEYRERADRLAAARAKLAADGWVLHAQKWWRWTGGTMAVEEDRGNGPTGIGPPVDLWVRVSPRHKWHRHPTGLYGSPCSWGVVAANGREVSAVEPLADVCSGCARWGAR